MEPAKKAEAAEKPKRQVKWGEFAEGFGGLVFALSCVGADIYNNAVFGMDKSAAIAGLFIVGGFGLAYLPGMAKGRSDVQVWALVVVCGLLTLFAGYQNHMASQKNHALADIATTERYNAAQAAIKAADKAYAEAKAEVARITETAGYDELKIAYDAASKLYEDNKSLCGPICRDARDQVRLLPDRMGQAKAKADAQKRADEAWARMEREKKAAPAQAKAAGASEQEEEIMAVLLLLLSVVGATVAHRSYATMKNAFGYAPKAKAARVAKKADAPASGEMGQKEKVQAFLDECTEASEGPPLGSSVFYDKMKEFWSNRYPGEVVPAQRMLGAALGKRYTRTKKGTIGYYAKVKKMHLAVVNG